MAQNSNNAAIDVTVETTKTIDAAVDNTGNIWASLEPFAGDVARDCAEKAQKSAEAAAASEQAAKASETAAKDSETAAAGSASAAAASEANAKTSETKAGQSEANAKASADAAAASAQDAHNVAASIGNPVAGVTEVNGKVTVTKADGAKNEFFAGLNMLQRNKAYAVGDIAYSPNLPSWAYLECVTAGTTGDTEPSFSDIIGGGTVADGTVSWIVRDLRKDGTDIEDLYKRVEENDESISKINENIDDLYSFANGNIVKRDLLAGVDLSKTTSVTDLGASNAVTFSHPYTNYDYLEFVGYDGDRWLCVEIIPVQKIKRMFEIASTTMKENWIQYIYLTNVNAYLLVWNAQNCTDTKWEHLKANGRTLAAIYGVNTKKEV